MYLILLVIQVDDPDQNSKTNILEFNFKVSLRFHTKDIFKTDFTYLYKYPCIGIFKEDMSKGNASIKHSY